MNRKNFLSLGIIGGLSAFGAKPLESSLFSKANDVKITDVKTYLFKKACYVKVETDIGISGWGESDGANKKITPLYVEKGLKQYVIGKDPFDSEGIIHEAYLKG